jgi:hypothetical protein
MTLVARSLVIINDVKRIMNVSNFFFLFIANLKEQIKDYKY